MSEEDAGSFRRRLDEAQKALEAALTAACAMDVRGADVAELLRLEEQLTVARQAANRAIAVLRRLMPDRAEASPDDAESHRVFVDDRGVQWDAFAVYPSRTKGRDTLPPPYDQGWLAVQCVEGVRRVTPIPQGWRECSRDEFCRLLETAPVTPRRTA